MTTDDRAHPEKISLRLAQILRVYCAGLDPRTLADLRDGIAVGRYVWFREEFAAAVRANGFTTGTWGEAIGVPPATPVRMREEQEMIWRAVFPGEPVPQPEPDTAAAAGHDPGARLPAQRREDAHRVRTQRTT